jgi:DNA replication and repair protein RecF
MRIATVEPHGFRNLTDAPTRLGPAITVLHGPNGAGKTNLIEAVYFGLTARSFRSGSDRDLIRFGETTARVELELDGDEGAARLLTGLDRSGERRHLLDGRRLEGEGGRPLVSIFHPDRLQLLKGPPARRRAHLDRFVAALRPARADLRARYGRTLAQRNALLHRVRGGEVSRDALATWDERLAIEAEALIVARVEAIEALAAPFAQRASSLGLVHAEICYRPRTEATAEEIAAVLAELRAADLGRAYVTFGPQLDEVAIRAAGRLLRRFGSQGEQRAALLGLLFAERDALIARGRPAPLMLLDDVMSELDPPRRRLLLDSLEGAGQALITATEPAHVPSSRKAVLVAIDGGASRALAAVA